LKLPRAASFTFEYCFAFCKLDYARTHFTNKAYELACMHSIQSLRAMPNKGKVV